MAENHGEDLGLPDLEFGEYLVEALNEVGPLSSDSMGNEIPITWEQVWAFSQSTSMVSEPWELKALISMSKSFLLGKLSGMEVLSIPPSEQD